MKQFIDLKYISILFFVCVQINFAIAQNLTSVKQASNELPAQKHLTIGITHAPPIIILSENKPPEGMLIDFLQEIAKLENWKISWVSDTWAKVFDKAKNNQIDLMTYIAYSLERTRYFDFSTESFVTGWGQVYAKENSNLQNILDFDKVSIAVVKDDIHAMGFNELCEKFSVDCQLIYFENYDESFKALERGVVDAAVCGSTVGVTYEKMYEIRRTAVMYNPTNALFAVAKNKNKQIINTIDSYLTQWKDKSNTPYSQGKVKWLNIDQQENIPTWLIYLIAAILTLLISAGIVVTVLRLQIKKHVLQHISHNKQLEQIIDLVPHMIYVLDIEGNIELVNKYAAKYFGLKRDEHLTKSHILDKVPQSSNLFDDDVNLFKINAHPVHKEITSINISADKIIFSLHKLPFKSNAKIPSVLTVGVDLTEEKEYQNKIQYMAQHDELTGLPNRQLLKISVKNSIYKSIKIKQTGAILFIDLDFFKNINDTLGHAAGDNLLMAISKRLQAIAKSNDMVARIGGDEFILHLKDVSTNYQATLDYIQSVSSKILKSISNKVFVNKQELFISASIGAIIYPNDANSYEQIMQRADIAMYQAKDQGRNSCVVFKDYMEDSVLKRHKIIADLRKAIDRSEFMIEFQPQIKGNNEQLIGFEALLRWKHPDGEVISPSEFIILAEESGLIIPIGNWVLEQVCIQIQKWLDNFNDIPFVTINLSVVQIHDDAIVDYLDSLLKKYKIPAHLIELELTETVLVDQIDKTVKTLSRLKKLGVSLSIDDFGTGYSSLSYLSKLPFDKLKIDYSFIKDIVLDKETKTIVKTIIGMTEDLDLEVIAEGVENKQQLDMLIEMGCHNFQGFYFDQPLPVDQIEAKYFNKKPS